MIFKKLKLKNFMSYSNAEIDFSGIHVACLVGQNGAGKSSLLDAITWTLWEEGRGKTDELIKLGKDEMSCELEFFIESDLYRVYRSRTKSFKNSQGKSNLEFQIFNSKEQSWISLSMSAVRQTQDLITKNIKMDYETFVNSVYLRQGKADEFTLKKPSERKQILADILGLEVYDKLCDSARAKTKELEQSLSLEQNLILNLEEKILREEELKSSLLETSKELNQRENELKEVKEALTLKTKELNEKREKEKQVKMLEETRQSHSSLIKTLEEQLTNLNIKEAKFNELIKNKNQIQKDYQNHIEKKRQLDDLEATREKHAQLLLKKNQLEQSWKEKIQDTEQKLAIYKSKISDRTSLKTKLQTMLRDEENFSSFSSRTEEEIKNIRKLQEYLLQIETTGLDLRHKKEIALLELAKVKEKEADIEKKLEALSQHNHSEPCPLCKGEIKDKEKVIESYESDLESLNKDKELLNRKIELGEKEIQDKRNEFSEVKNKIDGFSKDFTKYLSEFSKINTNGFNTKETEKLDSIKKVAFIESQIEFAKNEFNKNRSQLSLLEKEICEFEQEAKSLDGLLLSGNLVKEVSENLKSITAELNGLNYDPKAHNNLKQSINESERSVLTHSLLSQAETELETLKGEKVSLTSKIQTGHNELKKFELLIEENNNQLKNMDSLSNEVSNLREKELNKNNEVNDIKKQFILFEQSLQEIEAAKKTTTEKRTKIQGLLDDKKYFEILEKAFSKNGIQAAVIETVVPEIEKEANKILNRLTDNQMHIALKTQREKKSTSGMVETLDIVIADELGSRNYELYSGGEAFKVDFSLRLALSRLLTNRASAKLQSLIIDEGFGSQDSSGRERLVEVIKSIENEFELILVVTHIDELKESFPVQIQVTKDEEGSKVRLLA